MADNLFISNFKLTHTLKRMLEIIKKSSYSYFTMKLIAFLLLIFIADFSIGYLLKYYYFKQQSGFQYRTTYAIEETKADILIFGSSRAKNHFVPAPIEEKMQMSYYNVGRDGNHIFYNYALLKLIFKRYSPKIIVFDLVKGEFKESVESYEKISALLPYYDSHPEIRSIIELKSQFEKFKLFSKIYPYNSSVFSIAIGNMEYNKNRYTDIQGFVPWDKKIKCPPKTDSVYSEYKIDTLKVNLFESFIKDCKSNGIKLYVVVSPYYLISDITDSSIAKGMEIAGKYNVKFLNYSQDTTFKLNCSLFADITHLNADGADVFTRKFVKELNMEIVSPLTD